MQKPQNQNGESKNFKARTSGREYVKRIVTICRTMYILRHRYPENSCIRIPLLQGTFRPCGILIRKNYLKPLRASYVSCLR